MLKANAKAKPRKTGREMNVARKSTLKAAANMNNPPVKPTSAYPLAWPREATTDAKTAAAEDVADAMEKRLLPNTA